MKYLYIKIMIVFMRIFDMFPIFFVKLIFFRFKNKFTQPFNENIVAQIKTESNESLIWMDYSNAIGDFFAILKIILEFDKLNEKFSLLVHIKFIGIIEKLNLKNATIIYKKNSLGSHYEKTQSNIMDDIDKINDEFRPKKLCFDKIYYFNGVLLCDALTTIKNIKYNKLIMIDPSVFIRGRNSKYIDKNYIQLSIYYFLHQTDFKIETMQNKKNKNKSISFLVRSILGVDQQEVQKYFDKSKNNYILISSGTSNASKVLKEWKLDELLKTINSKCDKYFVGSKHDEKFVSQFMKNGNYKFKFNLPLIELFSLVNNANMIVSYDTGLYHMANFYNKDVTLIVNRNDFAYKYMKNYWIGEQRYNETRLILHKKNFYK